MNTGMWDNPVMQENLEMLQARGARIVAPGTGYLACGDVGAGRLEDPPVIVQAVLDALQRKEDLAGKRVLVTAGPTQEPLDPIRYISNLSSGRMGYDIAAEAVARGAQVTLVSGPCALRDPEGADVVRVRTAEQMLAACEEPFAQADVAVFVAAVSDWRPAQQADAKMKRDGSDLTVTFVPNPDIAATLGARKGGTYTVVFAAETGDPIEAAKGKLVRKNADLCVANNVSEPGMGMGAADNHVWLVDAQHVEEVPAANKRVVARCILDRVVSDVG
jgi:phosphopantothenoylcysteine decarboxylase/phosphopantothenate--cysteine ligase